MESRGEEIGSKLFKAIEGEVLGHLISRDRATTSWCLGQEVMILESGGKLPISACFLQLRYITKPLADRGVLFKAEFDFPQRDCLGN